MRTHIWIPALTMVLLLAGCAICRRTEIVAHPHITIDLDTGYLSLFSGEKLVKQYAVGIGKQGSTPLGTYVVSEKDAEPVWWDPSGNEIPYGHKDNVLGARWITLRATADTPDVRGYGIHGGWDGKRRTSGSICMRDQDIKDLFDLVAKDTPVLVVKK